MCGMHLPQSSSLDLRQGKGDIGLWPGDISEGSHGMPEVVYGGSLRRNKDSAILQQRNHMNLFSCRRLLP